MHVTNSNIASLFVSASATERSQPSTRASVDTALMSVRQRQHVHLHDRIRHVVTAVRGTLWITQDGDVRDWILEDGESMVIDRDADILISAMSDATIRLDN